MSEAHALMGDNLPPQSISERLQAEYATKLAEVAKWLESAKRAPQTVTSEEHFKNFGTIAGKLITFTKELETARKKEKEPYLRDGRAVDSFFAEVTADCETWKNTLERRQKAFAKKKEDDAKAEAARLEREALERAEQEMRAAERLQDQGRTDEAMEALTAASRAEEAAHEAAAVQNAKPAELVRSRAASGAMTSAKVEWTFEIEDIGKVPLEALRPYLSTDTIEKAIKAAVRGGCRQLAGVRIYEDRKIVNRGI